MKGQRDVSLFRMVSEEDSVARDPSAPGLFWFPDASSVVIFCILSGSLWGHSMAASVTTADIKAALLMPCCGSEELIRTRLQTQTFHSWFISHGKVIKGAQWSIWIQLPSTECGSNPIIILSVLRNYNKLFSQVLTTVIYVELPALWPEEEKCGVRWIKMKKIGQWDNEN